MSSRVDVIRSIQDEYEQETGERPTRVAADVMFDRMCDAFVEKFAAVGPEQAARSDMRAAEYLMNQWVGSDPKHHGDWGKVLRKTVREIKAAAETEPQVEATPADPAPAAAPARRARKSRVKA